MDARSALAEIYNEGIRYIGDENWSAAAGAFQQFLDNRPDHAPAHVNLGMARRRQGDLEGAVNALRQAVEREPDYCIALINLGSVLSQLGRHEEAIGLYRRALAVSADDPEAHNNLGVALFESGHFDEAERHFRSAVEFEPALLDYIVNLGNLLLKAERFDEAEQAFTRAMAIENNDPPTLLKLGYVRHRLKRHDSALELLHRAVTIDPGFAEAYAGLGRLSQEIGDFEAARTHLRQAIALNPDGISQYLNLAHISRLNPGDPIVVALLEMRNDIARLPKAEQIAAHFSLGKILDEFGQRSEAFEHLLKGNELRRAGIGYNESAALRGLQRIKDAMTADRLALWSFAKAPAQTPIFIVGMPRSGSTLVEQILSRHPAIEAAGESEALPNTLKNFDREVAGWRYLSPDYNPSQAHLDDMAEQYMRALVEDVAPAPGAGQAPFITDKMLGNFRHLGLIHHLFPHAKIIHTFRDPVETCLSCFAINFAMQPFTFELGELGRYYRAYAVIMRHWRHVLPAGTVLEVRYEAVVQDFEASARAIIAHCGLAWDDACLSFHEAERPVLTASVEQVRRPIYRTSLKRSRPEISMLKPLYEGLGLAPPG